MDNIEQENAEGKVNAMESFNITQSLSGLGMLEDARLQRVCRKTDPIG